jgi:hypothetical protein
MRSLSRFLWLYHNQLQGTIPPELCHLTQLKSLGLGRNQLSGEIPACLGEKLTQLQILYLSENALTGVLPSSLGKLNSLQQLYLDSNQFSTPLPDALVQMALSNLNLVQFHFQNNSFSLNECQAVQKLVARGGWIENLPGWFDGGLVHSPQMYRYFFDQDCPPAFPLLTITKKGDGSGLGTWNFKAWQGDCVGTTNPLPVLMNQSKHCTAIFEPALLIGLTDFSATVLAKGTVLQWQTASEIDTIGFHVWQAQAKERNCQDYVNYAKVTRLTDSLIESQGTLIGGTFYSYEIPTISPGSCYGLEAVDSHGSSTFYLIGTGIKGWLEVVD